MVINEVGIKVTSKAGMKLILRLPAWMQISRANTVFQEKNAEFVALNSYYLKMVFVFKSIYSIKSEFILKGW